MTQTNIMAIIIAVIITALVVGGGVYFWLASTIIEQPAAPVMIDTEDEAVMGDEEEAAMKVEKEPAVEYLKYQTRQATDRLGAISFKYAKGWHIHSTAYPGSIWEGEDSRGIEVSPDPIEVLQDAHRIVPVMINVRYEGGVSLGDHIEDFVPLADKIEDLTIAGYPAKKISPRQDIKGGGENQVYYLFVTPDAEYSIFVYYADVATRGLPDEYQTIIDTLEVTK